MNEELVATLRLSEDVIERVARREEEELARRERVYRGDRPLPDMRHRTAILVDDGLATGSTMRAAIAALRRLGPARIVVAVPTAPPQTCDELRGEVDELVCLMTPQPFYAVGLWYDDFSEVTDEEVRRLLNEAAVPAASDPDEREVAFRAGEAELRGSLAVPAGARGIVLFAHGSGSSRFSPRNRYVARVLNEAGFATLLIDLLTAAEEEIDRRTAELRFDVPLLAERLLAATDWLARDEQTRGFPLGYFGASTGAAAALVATAERPGATQAVVSRGGRPDLAGAALGRVEAPTLLIVGERDPVVLELNREAMGAMRCEVELEIVPGAAHLFEEPGALEKVAELARSWLELHLTRQAAAAP